MEKRVQQSTLPSVESSSFRGSRGVQDISDDRPLLPGSARSACNLVAAELFTRFIDETVGLAASFTVRSADQDITSCLPTSLQASSKLLGLDCFFRQPSTDFFARTFFQLLNRCKMVQDCSYDGVDLVGESVCGALRGGEQRGVQQRGSERV